MACSDGKPWDPSGIPVGSTYTLTVSGTGGEFSAIADYDDPTTAPHTAWGASDIVNRIKVQSLSMSGDHFVYITVGTLRPGAVVQARAEVRYPSGAIVNYCRTINTTNPAEKLIHQLRVV